MSQIQQSEALVHINSENKISQNDFFQVLNPYQANLGQHLLNQVEHVQGLKQQTSLKKSFQHQDKEIQMIKNSDIKSQSNPFGVRKIQNPFIQTNISAGIRLFGGSQLTGEFLKNNIKPQFKKELRINPLIGKHKQQQIKNPFLSQKISEPQGYIKRSHAGQSRQSIKKSVQAAKKSEQPFKSVQPNFSNYYNQLEKDSILHKDMMNYLLKRVNDLELKNYQLYANNQKLIKENQVYRQEISQLHAVFGKYSGGIDQSNKIQSNSSY